MGVNAIPVYDKAKGPGFYSGKLGWITSGNVKLYNGEIHALLTVNNVTNWARIIEFHVEPPTADVMRMFYTVNINHIRDLVLDKSDLMCVHAVRFWGVAAGMVMTTKSHEYTIVENPPTSADDADTFVNFALIYHGNAWTAIAARTTSWQRADHAAGGTIAVGFPRRRLQREGYWKGEDHCAILDPSCGLIQDRQIGASTTVRMVPNTQVSGTAAVVDAYVVLKMMSDEGIAPLLTHINRLNVLKVAYERVEQYGMRCAPYARWFYDEHPD
ncbi:unnamed protein product [Didymodactylos carnosus]|uniref:Uncharacterized protein n=1 Tax=Didymodactylos carnosus TaxID=1234261 RepID=A0A814UAU8_9BILA|nr:unnamed protein product [Didymodactylos carnosus]CAF1173325.1 unnamed protein product [Didymodactylos carnosus]CAF3711320.1 unnamed protein product [Didymodactylos carnosus]CAF3937104.1 unnamed protein product [Didymodactylos carnosus]